MNKLIPQFKNTEEALDYGEAIKGIDQFIRPLNVERERLSKEVQGLFSQGKESEALYLASGQAQFLREAIEQATKGV